MYVQAVQPSLFAKTTFNFDKELDTSRDHEHALNCKIIWIKEDPVLLTFHFLAVSVTYHALFNDRIKLLTHLKLPEFCM